MAESKRATDNPKHKREREHTHQPHVHPPGTYEFNVPHQHTVKYKKKNGEIKTYIYKYEVIGKRLANH